MYKPFWKLYIKEFQGLKPGAAICVLTVFVSLLEGLNIGLLVPLLENLASTDPGDGHWVSRVIENGFETLGLSFSLGTILLSLGALICLGAFIKYIRMILVAKTSIGFAIWMRSRYMGNLLNADMSYHHGRQIGVNADLVSIQVTRSTASVSQMTDILGGFGIVMAYLVVALLIAPTLTAVAVGVVFLISLGMQFYITRARRMSAERVVLENDYQATTVETLSAVHVIKSFLLESFRLNIFSEKAKNMGLADYRLVKNTSQMLIFQEMSLFAVVGGIVYIGVSAIALDITVIVALLFTLYRMMPRVTAINSSRQSLAVSLTTLEAVDKMVGEATATNIINGEMKFGGLKKSIDFDDVGFSYNGDSPVLTGTTFTIEKGKMTAIVGASGAGKTTIIDMLLRFYDPTSGQVLVDGVDLRELDFQDWRRLIGMVSQDVLLFNDTLSNNISLGREGVSESDIEGAATLAYAHEFIQRLPNGYQTTVGDRGWNLSGGQRQRIALARAILQQPEILLLDEATSSLDSESEQLMQQYIKSVHGTSTIVVVAHRLSTIRNADKILVLEDGAIVEEGDWEGLLADAGVLANFHRLQIGG